MKMKKLSKKWLILEHYVQTAEIEKNGVTIRVWKPKFMGKLPAAGIRELMLQCYSNYLHYEGVGKVCWGTQHPDYGYWDAQLTVCYDPHRYCVDIYICMLLMHPFSEEARLHYEERSGLEPMDRLILMWDSRQFDKEGGYQPDVTRKYGFLQSSRSYEDLYRVIKEDEDIEDTSQPYIPYAPEQH